MTTNENASAIEKLAKLIHDYQHYVLTGAEASNIALSLIEHLGAEEVLRDLPEVLRHEVFEWHKSLPVSDEDWKKQRVFEFRKDTDGLMEAVAVPMSEEEINARKLVATQIRNYLNNNHSEAAR